MAEQFKFLAPRNWDKYQADDKGHVRGGPSPWVKDWTDKDSDRAYMKLTAFQRYILDGCRRLRGKLGKNIPNDPGYIARALQVLPTERARVTNTIATLIERLFLVLTNQELDSLDLDKDIDKEKPKPSRRKAPTETDKRFVPFRDVLFRYHTKFVGSKMEFKHWFGNRGGKQLKNLLKAEPDLDVATFEKAVAVRARSPNVKHEQSVYEWIFHVLSGPKGFQNGQAGQVSKSQQRHERNNEKYRRVLGVLPEGVGGNLSLGDAGSGIGDVPGITEHVSAGGSEMGGNCIDAEAIGRLDGNTEATRLHSQDLRAKRATSGGH